MRKAGEVTFADCHKDRDGEGYEYFNYLILFIYFPKLIIILKIYISVVEFSSYEDMKNAIRKLDDTELKGKRIILREAPVNIFDILHFIAF